MTIQIKKTYRGINPEMLLDEMRGLVQKQGVIVGEAKMQTYGVPSGATQSLVTLVLKTQAEREEDQKECGSAHIIGSPGGETKMMFDIDEKLLPQEIVSALQEDLAFIFGSYEVKW